MQAEQLYQDALKAIDKKHYTEGIKLLEKALHLVPNEFDFMHELALAHHSIGNDKQATDILQRLVNMEPTNECAWNDLGNIYADQENYERALPCYEKAYHIKSDDTDVLYNYALALDNTGRFTLAITIYQQLLQRQAQDHEAWNSCGVAHFHLGQYDEALSCYQQAIQLYPKGYLTLFNIAQTNELMGNTAVAIEYYQKAISLNPQMSEAWNNCGVLFEEKTDYAQAEQCYQKAIDLSPNDGDTWHNLGYLYEQTEQWLKAAECYQKAIDLNPADLNSMVDQANVWVTMGQLDQSLQQCQQVLSIDAHYTDAHYVVATIYSLQQQKIPMMAALQAAIRLHAECQQWAADDPNFAQWHNDDDFNSIIKSE